MAQSVFVVAPEGQTGKSAVAYGLLVLLSRQVGRVGVFRPVTASMTEPDPVVELLLSHPAIDQEPSTAFAVTYDDVHADLDRAMSRIVDVYGRLMADYDALVVVGSDYTDISTGTEWATNSAVAANLGAPVVLVVSGYQRTADEVAAAVGHARADLQHAHVTPVAVVANRVDPDAVGQTKELLDATGLVGGVLPEVPLLTAPTVAQIRQTIGATLLRGNPEWLQRESLGFVVAAMSLPNVLVRMREAYTIIAPGDRTDVLPALLLAHQSGTFPALASIILNGGYRPPDSVVQLTDGGTFDTATRLAAVRGRLTADSKVKLQTALRLFDEGVDGPALLEAIDVGESDVVTPLMFQYRLIERARTDRKRVVLPESDDDRILQAADTLLRLGVADLILLGEENAVRSRASALGVDISAATIVSPNDPELVATFAAEYARLRAHKGMTVERAAEIVCDVSYFGTMMVHLGMADGMVSGAAHTTAHTIKPSFEIIKTVPGTKIVSSVFLMCLADEVLVYGDCAVNPDPTSEQLADIAISSATTAAAFGIDPRVAMLSYSTGTSGSGADVEKVRTASDLVHEQRPDLLVEGPIQYDAAVDASVARTKLPDSQVAGRATVLIFPDLNTGNNTYKAVQRSAGAIAIGPVLQGLNKPVNDLSRGALVADIVNTVAITAIQAQTTGETA